jgi:hypothetical protein
VRLGAISEVYRRIPSHSTRSPLFPTPWTLSKGYSLGFMGRRTLGRPPSQVLSQGADNASACASLLIPPGSPSFPHYPSLALPFLHNSLWQAGFRAGAEAGREDERALQRGFDAAYEVTLSASLALGRLGGTVACVRSGEGGKASRLSPFAYVRANGMGCFRARVSPEPPWGCCLRHFLLILCAPFSPLRSLP